MVLQLMMPIFHMRSFSSGYVEDLRLHWSTPQPVEGLASDVRTFAFRDLEISDQIFDGIETKSVRFYFSPRHLLKDSSFPILHKRSPVWDTVSVPAWKPLSDPKAQLAPVFTLKTPLKFEKMSSPVTKTNRKEFTNIQRGKAERAPVAQNLGHLQARVRVNASDLGIWLTINLQMNYLHADGKAKLGEYVKIGSEILGGYECQVFLGLQFLKAIFRQALRLADKDNKLLSLLFTVPPEYRQRLSEAAMHIHTCMPGEFNYANSQDESFKFLACHYSWYARYAEKVLLFALSLSVRR
jgi:hypothetical protein